MAEDLSARVAALELLVELLVLERCMMSADPLATIKAGMNGLTKIAAEWPGVPLEATDAMAEILARVMERIGEGSAVGDLAEGVTAPLRRAG
ncbi:hypothetical protein [Azospirillum tabaci]|uniref:hypothetical protein n=1 Tax=Azospirillum tabaci TaxID=2752310 RepID=UPI0016606F2D|nr:hypothetical protein [Azospirillum tabaci]